MKTDSGLPVSAPPGREGAALGVLGATSGFVSIVAVAVIGVTSFTAFDPPEWVRLGTLALFAISWLASVIMDVLGFRASNRTAAIAGFAFCLVSAAALGVMLTITG
jgi:hypothetical protein